MLTLPLPFLCFFHDDFAVLSCQGIELQVGYTVQAHHGIIFFLSSLLALLFEDKDNFHK